MNSLHTKTQGSKESRRGIKGGAKLPERVSLAVDDEELRAMRHVAKKRGLRDRRGFISVGPLLRRTSLRRIVREYRKDVQLAS